MFEKPPGGWASTSDASRLTPTDVLPETFFGTSVAISGDTVVVGTQSGSAYVFSKPTDGWADTSEASELTASDGSDYDQFGQSVAVSGNTVVVGAYLADLEADEEDFGAAYVFTKPNGGWEDTSDSVKLTAPDGAEGREFGQSLSMTGNTLVIGAPYSGYYIDFETYREAREAEDKTPYLGSVYVFTRPDVGWENAPSPVVKLSAPNGVPWTRFGWSVSVSSDAIAVGEPYSRLYTQPGGYEYRSGAAFVFARPSEGWSSTAEHRELPIPDIMPYDEYGSSVFTSGEVVVVGARDDDNENGPNAGSAYLFRIPTDGWASGTPLPDPVTLKAFDGPAGDRFGHSVAVDGEILVVGVPGDHDRVAGAAYAFVRQHTEWGYSRYKLDASDATLGGRFGTSVAVHGDTIVVGAPGTGGGNDPGAAFVFNRPEDRPEAGWGREYSVSQTARLALPDGPGDGQFAYSVAVNEDTIVVGSPGAGAAYVYAKPDTGWAHAQAPAKLTSPEGAASRRFGHAVSISGDMIVVGAPGGDGAGAAYVFTKPGTGWTATSTAARLTASDGAAGDRFGYSVSSSGSSVLVGAPGSESGDDAGAAYTFIRPAAGWKDTSSAAKLTAADGAAGDWFGHAVAVSGEFIAVGAHGADTVADANELEDSGAVYAFRRPVGGWTSSSNAQKLTAKWAGSGDTFGYAVSVSGDTLAVGMPNGIAQGHYYLRGAHSGSARIFTWPGLFWEDTPASFKIVPPNAETSRIFGVSLSLDGNTAVVGTVQAENTEASSAGPAEAFVYTRRNGEWDTSSPAALALPEDGSYSPQGLAVSEDGGTVLVSHLPVTSETTADETTVESGTVLVFTRPEGGWVSTPASGRLTMPSGESEGNFGRSVSIDGDTIVVGAYGDDEYYYDSSYKGSAYVYTRPLEGWAASSTPAKLTASAGDNGDQFGRAVAVSGNTIVVTAPGDRDILGGRAGSAYLFTRPASGWVSTSDSTKLVSPDGWGTYWTRTEFGASVAVRGDKVVIGAPTLSYFRATGGAYVFTKPADGWDNPYIVSKLTVPLSEQLGRFGVSVSMSENAIYVGASGSPGQVYVFPIPAGREVFTGSAVRLSDPHGGIRDAFGGVVSAGLNGVAVGALLSDDSGEDWGAAYIFTEPSDGWSYSHGPMGQTAKLVSPDWYPGHVFGFSMSPSTDAIGVGAPSSYRASNPGAAYVFTGPFSSLYARDDAAKLSSPDGEGGNGFGWSVSLNSDAMAVGAPSLPQGSGSAYVFTKPDAGWGSTSDAAKLTSPGDEPDSAFGYSVSLSGATLAVGTPREDGAGSVYLFTKPNGEAWHSATDFTEIEIPAPDVENSSQFGRSVALTDDTIVVGMPGPEGVGAVYLYAKPQSGWGSVSAPIRLTPPDGESWNVFGASVAISGETVVVGAAGIDDIPGATYVFTKPSSGWISNSDAAKLMPETSESRVLFGSSVAVDGDTVVVGGQDYETYYGANTAYVFTRPAEGWVSASGAPVIALTPTYARLEAPVGIVGDTVFVSAPDESGIGAVLAYEDFFDE